MEQETQLTQQEVHDHPQIVAARAKVEELCAAFNALNQSESHWRMSLPSGCIVTVTFTINPPSVSDVVAFAEIFSAFSTIFQKEAK